MPDYDVRLKSNGKYWQAYWRTPSGPRVKSLGPKSKISERQAKAKCRQLAVDLRIGAKRDGTAPRLSEWIKTYISLRTDLSPSSLAIVEHTGRYLMAYFESDPTIDRITRTDAAEWRAALARGELRNANRFPKPAGEVSKHTRWRKYHKDLDRSKIKPLAEATVCRHVRAAKRMFEEAADDEGLGLIDRNPFRRLKGKAPKPVKTWQSISRKDLDRIMSACPNDGWRHLFALARLAGLRRGEALSLEWGDIRFDENRLIVNAGIEKETTKKRVRTIPIEPEHCPTGLHRILQDGFDAAPAGAVLVCDGVDTSRIHTLAMGIIRKAGLPPYRKPFHTLRKNRAGEIARKYPMHVLAEWMGHDIAVAEEYYLRVDDDLFASPPSVESGTNCAKST